MRDERHGKDGTGRRPGRPEDVDSQVAGKRTLVEAIGPTAHLLPQARTGPPPGVGKRTLIEETFGSPSRVAPPPAQTSDALPVQQRANGEPGEADVHAAAARGVATPESPLPHLDEVMRLVGRTKPSSVKAHTGPEAAASARDMGADAYATGDHIVLGHKTDLHTVAHEATHVIQQRAGVHLKGGVGSAGDVYERQADAVADRVVAGRSAEDLLDQVQAGGPQQAAVQRAPAIPTTPATGAGDSGPEVTPPKAGINKPGFIDNSDGSFIRTGPAEAGGKPVRSQPLPPATRVFVSGTHPSAPEWWYVTALLEGAMVRGYVQHGRVNTDLPEPTARLHQVVGGDTAEKLAVQEYKSAVRDGHDLRYYENVLLYVNKHDTIARDGITGTYQAPGVLGGGGNNVQMTAGHRIWLVSPAYAKTLEGVVPDGSLTGGAVAKAKRFVAHLEDILKSVTESRHHFDEVAGEYAQAIRDHLPEIAGIVAAFIMAEATSAFLAATPTGVGQIAAVVIQLALSAFGAAGAIQASAEAGKHGAEWLTLAWTAKGDDKQVAAASKEFLKMLVSVAMAALSALGAKANYGNALKIASSMPTDGLPAMAFAGGGQVGGAGAGAGTGVLVGPGPGSLGIAGNAMIQADKDGGGGDGPRSADPAKELDEIKQQLESEKKLSGKEKKELRARKKELQEQLGQAPTEQIEGDVPTPTRFKLRVSGLSGKEAATDIPSWAKEWADARPGVDENGTTFATRMMNRRYGVGAWEKAGEQNAEFSKLKKFGDRAFE